MIHNHTAGAGNLVGPCRLCSANESDGLIDELAEAIWEGRRESGAMDVGPWATAGDYWHEAYREHATIAIDILRRRA